MGAMYEPPTRVKAANQAGQLSEQLGTEIVRGNVIVICESQSAGGERGRECDIFNPRHGDLFQVWELYVLKVCENSIVFFKDISCRPTECSPPIRVCYGCRDSVNHCLPGWQTTLLVE